MSNQQTSNDEIDLMRLVRSLKKGFHNLLISLYHFIQFLLRNWIVITILFIVGVGLGYWKDTITEIGKESNLILKINMEDASYLYDAVEKLNRKIADNDIAFLQKYELYKEQALIKKVELKPMVELNRIAAQYDASDNRNLDLFFENINEETVDFNEELSYKSKRQWAKIALSVNATTSTITNFIKYLNDNPQAREAHEIYKLQLKERIHRNEDIISQIDSIINKMIQDIGRVNELNLNSKSTAAILLENKNSYAESQFNARKTLITSESIIVALNNIELYNKQRGLSSIKKLVYPVILILVFIIFCGLIKFYKRLKKISENANKISVKNSK